MQHDAHMIAWNIYNLNVKIDVMNLLWWLGELN